MVIRALPLINTIMPNVFYLIVGSGEEEKYLRDLAATLGVVENVVFVGSIADDERAAYYSAVRPLRDARPADRCRHRRFRNRVFGGGGGGKTRNRRTERWYGGSDPGGITGLRVDDENPSAIATAVIDLLVDTTKAESMGRAGRRRVKEAFTWEKIVERTRHVAAAVGGFT